MAWSKVERRLWLASLQSIGSIVLPVQAREWPRLVFINRSLPGILALADPDGEAIGIAPAARRLGPICRQEVLIHEWCHLATGQYHTRRWKALMHRAAKSALRQGKGRLAAMLERDIENYQYRRVSGQEIRAQLSLLLGHVHDKSFPNISSILADWAGWPRDVFLRKHSAVRAWWLEELRRRP